MSRSFDLDALEAIAFEVADAIRAAVEPGLGEFGSRASVGTAPGGDTTMAIDELAEAAVARVVHDVGNLAYYSEDCGLVRVGSPRAILIIDPIDGTRPAAAGFEACCASIAVVPPDEQAVLGDVQVGVVQELGSGTCFVARRGAGARVTDVAGTSRRVRRSPNTDMSALFLGASNRARPLVPLAYVLGELVDGAAMGGGYFELGSATFALTRIVTGQLDAYVDPGQRMIEQFPVLEAGFRNAGRGSIGTNFPYDVAAAALIVSEAGGVITDAAGRSLDGVRAVGSGPGFGLSAIAAASEALHAAVLETIDRGIERLGTALEAGNAL